MERFSELLSKQALSALRGQKNLLAFSAGLDSSALFFLLVEADIAFDIAIVDYGMRPESTQEVLYAKTIAQEHLKQCYHDKVSLQENNFEHHARQHRYQFFETIIQNGHYDNLITAHQLNDRLEWLFMQLIKGAGLVELLGFEEIEKRLHYKLIRPLLNTSKADLKSYLAYHDKAYFTDSSNEDEKYLRNYIRTHFSNKLLDSYTEGIKKSFQYLEEDKRVLFTNTLLFSHKNLYVLKHGKNWKNNIRNIDKVIKKMGYILSFAQREEIQKQTSCVIGNNIVIAFSKTYIYLAPYTQHKMEKGFKELCRTLKIPPKIRPYLLELGLDPTFLLCELQASERAAVALE